jgi:hypothetical protein
MPEQKTDDRNFVSMLDLEKDVDEIMGFNPEADANALLPPVPAGQYLAKLRFTETDPEKRWMTGAWGKNAQKVVYTSITGELYNTPEGTFDGRQVRDGLVSSMIRQQTGTCRIQGLVQGITGAYPPSCRTRPQMVMLVNDLIQQGATSLIDVDWEASENLSEEERDKLKDAGKKPFRLQGMKNFPKEMATDDRGVMAWTGGYIPEVQHNGEAHRAYNIITRYVTAPEGGLQGEQPAVPVVLPPVRNPQVRTAPPVPTQPGVQASAQAAQGPPVPHRAAQGRTAPRAPQGPPRVA